MASLSLATVWLYPVSAPTDVTVLSTMSSLAAAPQAAGSTRRYASGRFRTVTQAGIQEQLTVAAVACDRTQINWLRSHIGVTLLVRDDRGRKFYGAYFNPAVTEHPYDANGDVTLTITEVTFSESV
jgi:hypothetical protein